MTQTQLLTKIGEWSNPQELAGALGPGWKGDWVTSRGAVAFSSQGTVGAVLQAPFSVGHMVVISPAGEGRFLVRDPWAGGSHYIVDEDWIRQWVSAVVYQEG